MDHVFVHTQILSADANVNYMTSTTAWRFTALCRLHRLCTSIRRLCIVLHYLTVDSIIDNGSTSASVKCVILCHK